MIPAVISFGDFEPVIGDEAVLQLHKNSQNTIYDLRKLIGKKDKAE